MANNDASLALVSARYWSFVWITLPLVAMLSCLGCLPSNADHETGGGENKPPKKRTLLAARGDLRAYTEPVTGRLVELSFENAPS